MAGLTGVMVLAAGLGTRLRPLTDERPKPLVPVGDRSALEHVLERVRGLAPVVVNTHHFAVELAQALSHDATVRVSHEAELLGTAGGVAHASAMLGDGDVLVWNADVLAPLNAGAVACAHANSDADATLVVRVRGERGEGNVGLDAEDRIVRLRKESFAPGETRGAEFLGVHVLSATLRATLPRVGCLVGDVYLPRGHAGARLRAFVTDVDFLDVGTLDAYVAANFGWLRTRGLEAFVRSEVPSGITIGRDVIVPAGTTFSGTGMIERVVVWPGASVRAPIHDAVVTPRSIVPIAVRDG